MKKYIILGFVALLFSCLKISAQVNEVKLVASGEGMTETEAVHNALRSAIEQTYGVFVSANTDILNDDLVKDEVVTVSSGNIHSYKILGCVELANGNKSVQVEAVVSVSSLVDFAKAKGATCEFAGAVFGANLKMVNLNKENAEKALEHLYEQLNAIASNMYDYELNVGEPKVDGNIEITVLVKANENYKQFTDIVYNTLTSLSSNNVGQLDAMNVKYTKAAIDKSESTSMSAMSQGVIVGTASELKQKRTINVLYDLHKAVETINEIQKKALFSFTVTDNLQKVYPFNLPRVKSAIVYDPSKTHSRDDLGSFDLVVTSEYGLDEYGNWSDKILLWAIRLEKKPYSLERKYWTIGDYLLFIPEAAPGTICMYYRNNFTVPVEYLMQLTGFTVEHKGAL